MIRVLIVDDSRVLRMLLAKIYNSDPELIVVGMAEDGEQAVQMVKQLKPDVVSMDIIMPRMDGFEATRRIMEQNPLPILIVSASTSTHEVQRSFKAMESGALTVVDKPTGPEDPRFEDKVQILLKNIKVMSEIKVVGRRFTAANHQQAPRRTATPPRRNGTPEILGIGASTGGPQVVSAILKGLPKSFTIPVLITQHIAAGFNRGYADWLSKDTALDVCLGSHDEALAPGRCYVAPSGLHMGVSRENKLLLSSQGPIHNQRPSINFMLNSLADVYGNAAMGVLLTGMGNDGVEGMKRMHDKGAVTIAQDPGTAVIASMPEGVVKAGAASFVLSPEKIIAKLLELVVGFQ